MVGVERDLCGSSSPTLLLKQGHLQQAAQDLVQAGLEYLQRRRLHNFPGQPVPVLHHLQSKEVLPHVQMELAMLQFVGCALKNLGVEGACVCVFAMGCLRCQAGCKVPEREQELVERRGRGNDSM